MLDTLPEADFWRTSTWTRRKYAYMEKSGRLPRRYGGNGGAA